MLSGLTCSCSTFVFAVPVARAADSASKGAGTVHLHPTDPTILLGKGTKFTKQVQTRMTIQLGKDVGFASAEVIEVISDEELK